MIKNSIGELKLSPMKDEGMFVFYNDFITINGKVSKGDRISIFVPGYEVKEGKYHLDPDKMSKAELVVRGQKVTQEALKGHKTIDDLYQQVSNLYKDQFYFGAKKA